MGKINKSPGMATPINFMHMYFSVAQNIFIDNGIFRKQLDIIGEIYCSNNLRNILQTLTLMVL